MPADEPATGALPDLTGWLGRTGRTVTSPAQRCRRPGAPVEPRLGPWDLGSWTGRALAQLPQEELAAWRADPGFDTHGGQSLLALAERVEGLLSEWRAADERLVAVTHAAVIKTAVVAALRAPVDAVWDVDVALGSTTELHPTAAGWRVAHVNRLPVAAVAH